MIRFCGFILLFSLASFSVAAVGVVPDGTVAITSVQAKSFGKNKDKDRFYVEGTYSLKKGLSFEDLERYRVINGKGKSINFMMQHNAKKGTYSILSQPLNPGEYDLSVKLKYENGQVIFSPPKKGKIVD